MALKKAKNSKILSCDSYVESIEYTDVDGKNRRLDLGFREIVANSSCCKVGLALDSCGCKNKTVSSHLVHTIIGRQPGRRSPGFLLANGCGNLFFVQIRFCYLYLVRRINTKRYKGWSFYLAQPNSKLYVGDRVFFVSPTTFQKHEDDDLGLEDLNRDDEDDYDPRLD